MAQTLRAIAAGVRSAAAPSVLTALLLLALLFLGHRFCTHHCAFDSDTLLVPDVCRDLLGRGYEFSGWHLPNAPYLFPDILLALLPVALCKGLFATYLLYNVLHHGIVLAALTGLFRQTGLRTRAAYLLACSGLLCLFVAHLDGPYTKRAFLLFYPGNHTGIIALGLVLSLLVVRNLHRRMPLLAAAVFVAAGGLGLFSDRLLLPQFLAPLCGAVVLLALCRLLPLRKAAETLLLTAGVWAGATLTQHVCKHCGCVLLPLNIHVDFSQTGETWATFLTSLLPKLVGGQLALEIALITFVPAAAVAGLWHLWLGRANRAAPAAVPDEGRRAQVAVAAIALTALGCCASNVGALILSGVARVEGAERYLLAVVFVPFLFLGICLRFLPGRPLRLLGRAFPLLVAGFACVQLGVRHRAAFALDELQPPYPEVARALDGLVREGKIGCGIATFWNARQVQYLTHERVPIRTVHPWGEPWLHAQNPNAYLAPGRDSLELPHYNFILFTEHDPAHPMRREEVERQFGTPRERIPVAGYEIWIYDGLLNTRFNLFLRSMLAHRCRAAQAFIGPDNPAALAEPKAERAQWGMMALAPDGEVRVAFPRPVRGELLDFGAQFDGHYDLLFYAGEELLTTLYVPRVNCPAASAHYCMPGNQNRLLTLPPVLRTRPWTSIAVRGKGGPGQFALGHVLVYEQTPPGLKTRQTPVGGQWHYEAEIQPGLGDVVQDSEASGGRARCAPGDFSGAVVFGPYAFLEKGRYRVDFLVKAGPGGDGSPIARLEVLAGGDCRPHAQRDLFAADFAGADGYRKFSLYLETDVELSDCQFHLLAFGKAALYVDCVDLICEE